MYEAVRPYPAGRATVARYAHAAGRYGYDGIVVRGPPDAPRVDPDPLRERYETDVARGIEVDATNRDRFGSLVRRDRGSVDIVIARGGPAAANRFAAERERVDVLLTPPDDPPAHATIGVAADHGVRIGVDLGGVRRERGGTRVRTIDALRTLYRDLADQDAPYVVTGTPESHLGLRAPRDLAALGAILGADADWIRAGLTAWAELVGRNRRRRAADRVEAGVTIASEAERDSGPGVDR